MSDFLYNEVPVNPKIKTYYTADDWKLYAVHDDKNICGFFGDYHFLSNFHIGDVYYEGLLYKSTECAYQSAKILSHLRSPFQNISPAKSKKFWKTFEQDDRYDDTSADWDDRKYDVMSGIVFEKFHRNKHLRELLLATGNKYLEETNHWDDQYWGVDINAGGQNKLGMLLMNLRTYFLNHETNRTITK
jgi:ribA/ribD-fused uncharacterized protein